MKRCDLTDLDVTMCAHCLGHREERPAPAAADFADRPWFTARYDGRCACGEPFRAGDQIRMAAVGWIAECCAT